MLPDALAELLVPDVGRSQIYRRGAEAESQLLSIDTLSRALSASDKYHSFLVHSAKIANKVEK